MNLILSDVVAREVVNLLGVDREETVVLPQRELLLSQLQRDHKFYRLVLEPITPVEPSQSFPSTIQLLDLVGTVTHDDWNSWLPDPAFD